MKQRDLELIKNELVYFTKNRQPPSFQTLKDWLEIFQESTQPDPLNKRNYNGRMSTHVRKLPRIPDYADSFQRIKHAVAALEEGLPDGDSVRIQAAMREFGIAHCELVLYLNAVIGNR